jgi:hypothetical protein
MKKSEFKGRPPKVLTKQDILSAMLNTKSNHAAARYLNVSYPHYKRYAKLYKEDESDQTLFEKHRNPAGKGIRKLISTKISRSTFKKMLTGDCPIYSWNPETLKNYIIHFGILKEHCNKCGFKEKRVIDFKPPLLLNFKDGSKRNWNLKNLEFLCYNCYFLYVSNIFSKKQIISLEDYNTGKQIEEVDWEIDLDTLEHFREIGLMQDPAPSGSEYISYL